MSATPDQAAPRDPLTVIKSKEYLRALVLAALNALPVAVVAYGFLALVDWLQEALFTDLPSGLGFDSPPIWWPLPLLAISGLLVALCIRSLPGNCGHSPSGGSSRVRRRCRSSCLVLRLRRWRSAPCSAPRRR